MENLKALVYGKKLTQIQKAKALQEFEQLEKQLHEAKRKLKIQNK